MFPFSGAFGVNRMRQMKEIERIIYVGSSHRPPTRDLLEFSNIEKKSDLDMFLVKQIVPVDASPFTMRVDFAILCERMKPSELPEPTRKPQPLEPKPKNKNTSKSKKNRPKILPPNNRRRMNYSAPHMTLRGARSNFFPTEDMIRNFASSNFRKSKQIDYQKRDSLYPVPLRGNLYQGDDDGPYYNELGDFRYKHIDDFRFLGTDSGYSQKSRNYPGSFHVRRGGNRNQTRQMERYTNFRRDLQDALDETTRYRPKQITTQKLAYANALLEEGIRLASEAMDNGYPSTGYGYQNQRQRNTRSGRYPRY